MLKKFALICKYSALFDYSLRRLLLFFPRQFGVMEASRWMCAICTKILNIDVESNKENIIYTILTKEVN